MYSRVTLVLNQIEMEQLRLLAKNEFRKPRDQLHFILRSALGLSECEQENKNPLATTVSQAEMANGFAISQPPPAQTEGVNHE